MKKCISRQCTYICLCNVMYANKIAKFTQNHWTCCFNFLLSDYKVIRFPIIKQSYKQTVSNWYYHHYIVKTYLFWEISIVLYVFSLHFLLFINDLPDIVKSNARLFADDCLLYRVINSKTDQLQLQEDLTNLEKWEKRW
jgi:competence protein ComGC